MLITVARGQQESPGDLSADKSNPTEEYPTETLDRFFPCFTVKTKTVLTISAFDLLMTEEGWIK